MPKEMAHSHLGMATDGRYIYVVTGQYGPQCRGPTARNFVLDTETKQRRDLPPLPVPRYVTVVVTGQCVFLGRNFMFPFNFLPLCLHVYSLFFSFFLF